MFINKGRYAHPDIDLSLHFAMDLRIPKDCRRSFTLELKRKLAERALHFKKQWQAECAALPREWNPKTRKWEKKQPKWGYLRKTIDENFPEIRGKMNNVSFNKFCF